jgi:hypothetical protein
MFGLKPLIVCLLAGSSSAFAIKQLAPVTTALKSLSVSAAAPVPDLKAPAALYQGSVAAGAAKAKAGWGKIFKLGVVSGCHIGFGAYLAIAVGGACPGIAAENPGLQKVMN